MSAPPPAPRLRTLVRRPRVLRDLRRLDRMARFAEADVVFGNRAEVLEGGDEAYRAMLASVEEARTSLTVEMYTWSDDRAGRRFADAVRAACRRGVAVCVLLDAFGSLGSDGVADALEAAGARVQWYNRLAPWVPQWFPNRRNHRKVIVADGRVGFVGGINLAECYACEFTRDEAWFDLAVRIEGPAVRDLVRLFVGTWARAGGSVDEIAPMIVAVPERGPSAVQVIGRFGRRGRRAQRRAFLAHLALAQERAILAYGYFAPPGRIRRALERAARRGVAVDLLVPGPTDMPVVRWAGRAMYGRLLAGGLRIREVTRTVLHAKAMVVDGKVAAVGSANLDSRSFRHNLEVVAHVFDADVAAEVEAVLRAEWERAEEVELEAWRARPLSDRMLERLAWSARWWL